MSASAFRLGRSFTFAVAVAMLAAPQLRAQARAEQTHVIASAALGEERTIWVSLPDNYDVARRSYPVVIVLDGQDRRLRDLAAAAVRFDNRLDFFDPELPPQIVVGIASGNRGSDFGSGSGRMRRFVLDEVGDLLRARYRVSGLMTVVGHSLSASFAMELGCNAPAGLNAIVAISPALADTVDLRTAQQCLRRWTDNRPRETRSLFIAYGRRANDRTEESFRPQVIALQEWLRRPTGAPLRWVAVEYPSISHSRTPLRGIPDGIAFTFSHSILEPADSMKRRVIDGRADPLTVIDAHVAQLSGRIGAPVVVSPGWLKLVVALGSRAQMSAGARTAIDRGLALYPEDPEFLLLAATRDAQAGDTVAALSRLTAARTLLSSLPDLPPDRRAELERSITQREAALRRRPEDG